MMHIRQVLGLVQINWKDIRRIMMIMQRCRFSYVDHVFNVSLLFTSFNILFKSLPLLLSLHFALDKGPGFPLRILL